MYRKIINFLKVWKESEYWESERGAEIDFVIQRDGQLIPIEVKSADNTKAKSLRVYMDAYKPT